MAVRSPATKALFTVLKNLQLRPVKKIGFSFDPFRENVTSIRFQTCQEPIDLYENIEGRPCWRHGVILFRNGKLSKEFLFHINSPKILDTNPKCSIKSVIVCNRAEPVINLELDSGLKFCFNTENLTTLEIAQEFDRIVTVHDKVPEQIIVAVQQKKAVKARGKPGKK